ncbi:MAG: alpha-amylase family glycosyl hydrolase [Christensenellales bacterium]
MRIVWEQDSVAISGQGTRFVFDSTGGRLREAVCGDIRHAFTDLLVDAGVDGRYLRGQMAYDPLDDKRTWELPRIEAVAAGDAAGFLGFSEQDGLLAAEYLAGDILIRQKYDLCGEALRLRAEVINRSAARVSVGGVSFLLRRQAGEGRFEYPSNDSRVYADGDLQEGQAHSCGLVGAMTHLMLPAGDINLLFLDEVEKWSQGAYRSADAISHVFAAAVESHLAPGEGLEVGCLYLCPVSQGEDPYLQIRGFFDALGYRPAVGGLREGVLYSCHPHGTMDGGFKLGLDLNQFAGQLPAIRAMGVDHVWLLPIFEHLDRGVYHPVDQRPIDARYGGEEGMRIFSDQAHALGMTVLFDYVPHGPQPEDPLALAHPDWCSKRRDLSLQDEWHCVSFDMTHPEYLDYTGELVGSHVRRFGIDGARIDCAMGGLSNWAPFPGHRPSASNLAGGVAISRAIREGFQAVGHKALSLPENFNPVPAYYPVTDVFYGMNLYRVMSILLERGAPAEDYVRELTRFLEIEHKVMPEELKKLRFLGNHDTVSWVWQKKRAYESYGVAKAKALFALMFFIDGVPMIYQGDEDPAIAGKAGPKLDTYFAELSRVRKALIGEGCKISYLSGCPGVMAFVRDTDAGRRLVLISLMESEQTVTLDLLQDAGLAAGEARCQGSRATLPPYAWAIFTLA